MKVGVACVSMMIAAVVAPIAFAEGALESIDTCIKRLDAQADVGYERVAARCPDLTRRLETSGWAPWLPPGWNTPGNDLSAGSLTALHNLVVSELATRAIEHPLRPDVLPGILAGLGHPDVQKTGWWTRFTLWLREVFDQREQSSDDRWYDRVMSHVGPTQTLVELISYLCLGLVVLSAAVIVANELRVAGLLRAPIRGRTRSMTRLPTPSGPKTWSEVQSAPFEDRPRLLLLLIAARLVDQNRLPAAGSFTVRELTQAARLEDGEDRMLLADVGFLAERARFSAQEIPASSLEAAMEQGRTLLEHLETAATLRQPTSPDA